MQYKIATYRTEIDHADGLTVWKLALMGGDPNLPETLHTVYVGHTEGGLARTFLMAPEDGRLGRFDFFAFPPGHVPHDVARIMRAVMASEQWAESTLLLVQDKLAEAAAAWYPGNGTGAEVTRGDEGVPFFELYAASRLPAHSPVAAPTHTRSDKTGGPTPRRSTGPRRSFKNDLRSWF
jgi:hypothetical protein